MAPYTHTDITFDRFGRIHVEPMHIGTFAKIEDANLDDVSEDAPPQPKVVDVAAWYNLIGQKVLDYHITELNANGHSKLTIKENGDIVIKRQKTFNSGNMCGTVRSFHIIPEGFRALPVFTKHRKFLSYLQDTQYFCRRLHLPSRRQQNRVIVSFTDASCIFVQR